MEKRFLGYRRDNGRVGIRNHVIILPVDDLSNAACEAVANNIKGSLAIPHPYGRLQFGADLELHFRTIIGAGSNPNVAAVVVIGIEEGWTQRVVEGIARTGKPVKGFGNPILPVIKLSANPRTVRTMSEHIDLDCSGVLQREATLDEMGDRLLEVMMRTCNGRLTPAEVLYHREFVLTRLYESA